jgi:hypothetical protein
MTVYMPDTDYRDICDATREKCGTTGLLKSWEIQPLLAALETDGAKFYLTVNVDSGRTVVATKGSLSVSGTAKAASFTARRAETSKTYAIC